MTDDRSLERAARSWLEIGPTEAPERAVEAALLQIETTPQERDWHVPWRLPRMTTPFRAAAAAVLGVLAIGGVLFVLRPGDSSVGGPGPTPTPTPVTSPALSPSPAAYPPLTEGPLAAGTYVLTPFRQLGNDACFAPPQSGCIDSTDDDSVRVTVTVPDGWSGAGSFPNAIWPATDHADAPFGASLVFARGASLYSEPCGPEPPPDIPVGPTVEDFASALAAHPKLDVTTPVDVNLAGYSGKYIDLQVPDDISACPDSYWPWEPGFYAQGPGHRWHLWILDVDGVRVVVIATDYAGTSPQRMAELEAMVASIQIEP